MNVKMSSGKDRDTENQVVSSATNLSEAVGSVLWSCESAFVKVNSKKNNYVAVNNVNQTNKYASFKVAKYKNGSTVSKEYSPIMKNKPKSKFLDEVRAMK
eukprot:NODE_187_length_13529_cov_1.102606.p12 type:complete len:100 gc:universal NODE_187_length_13529_cov_1.102606:10107-9808(-)